MRLAGLLCGLSRFADLGFGLEAGTSARSCMLAMRLGDAAGLAREDLQAAYYTALLHHVGCVGYAHETTRLFGDDLAADIAAGRTDAGSSVDLFRTWLPTLTRGRPAVQRARLVATTLRHGQRWGTEFTATACELGRDTAIRLGLPDTVADALGHAYDLWSDRGEEIPVAARVVRLTGVAALYASLGGSDVALGAVRRRSGGMLDPELSQRFARRGRAWLEDGASSDPATTVLLLEPRPHVAVTELRRVAESFGDLADLKSPFFLGHSRAVASLARAAAHAQRLPSTDVDHVEIAGLLHDLGRVAVSNAIWEKAATLTVDDREQVRLHAYQTERILAAAPDLEPYAATAARHHERLDGSGYHRGSTGAELSTQARLLAAADAYRTALEPRPHRAALAPDVAAARVRQEVSRGRLDHDAVNAVLRVAGHRAPVSPQPHPLSPREVEVLVLVARGLGNAEIAQRLTISRRTAEHHVQHVYAKIGVSSRAAAALYAVRHHLVEVDG